MPVTQEETTGAVDRVVLEILLRALVAAHLLFLAGHLAAFVYLPVRAPWYVALPGCTFQALLVLSDWRCPLTALENRLRRRLGRPAVRGFVGHYLLAPVRRARRRAGGPGLVR